MRTKKENYRGGTGQWKTLLILAIGLFGFALLLPRFFSESCGIAPDPLVVMKNDGASGYCAYRATNYWTGRSISRTHFYATNACGDESATLQAEVDKSNALATAEYHSCILRTTRSNPLAWWSDVLHRLTRLL